jgi:hypothetical protein
LKIINLRLAKPVLSITSESADVGKIISESGAGFNITSNKVEEFINIIEMISSEDYDIKLASKNARELFDKKFTTDVSYNIIITAYNQRSNDKQ